MKTITYLLLASAFFIFDTDGKDRRGRQIENFSGGIGFILLGIITVQGRGTMLLPLSKDLD